MRFRTRLCLLVILVLNALAAHAAERITYFVPDTLGSPVAAMDEQGDVLWRETYAPYGERTTRTPENNARPAYTGKPEDSDTGLVYMGARMYDPETARFLGTDPVLFRIKNPQSFNRYFYGNNSPYMFVDPDGREEVDVARRAEGLANRNREFRAGGFAKEAQTQLKDSGGMAAKEAVMLGGSALAASALRAAGLLGRQAKHYGPMNKGPLGDDIANTFRSGSYTERTLSSDQTLYRVISENGNPAGSFWTATRPQGPLQSVIDSALDQNWGNTAERVVTARVPAGTTIYEGVAAAQRGLVGGGNQIYIPKVDPGWIQ